jgi:hypothetical protein
VREEGVEITLPGSAADPTCTVIALEFDGPPEVRS